MESKPQEDRHPSLNSAMESTKKNDTGPNSHHSSTESSEIVCNACGFEASYVPEGMLKCERCEAVHYCSLHCLQWDWKSGGHAETCVDIRPDNDPDSEHSESRFADDGTMVSMDIRQIFQKDDQFEAATSSHSGTTHSTALTTSTKVSAPPSPKATGPSDSLGGVKDKQSMRENKSKTTADSSGKGFGPPPRSKSSSLIAFFDKQGQKTPAAPLPRSAPPPVPLYQNQDDDDGTGDGSQSIDIMEEEEEMEEEQSVLHSIVEEESVSEEPEIEGSWRDRDPFESASKRSLLRSHDVGGEEEEDNIRALLAMGSYDTEQPQVFEEEVVEETSTEMDVEYIEDSCEDDESFESMQVEDELKNLEHNVENVMSQNGGVPRMDSFNQSSESSGSGIATKGKSSSGSESLKEFRNIYSERSPGTESNTFGAQSLKDFRNVYGAEQAAKIEEAIEEASLQSGSMGGTNNEVLKQSINKALRDFEKIYGEEAARIAVLQLTKGLELDSETSEADVTEWSHESHESQGDGNPSGGNTSASYAGHRYASYRSSLKTSDGPPSATRNLNPSDGATDKKAGDAREDGRQVVDADSAVIAGAFGATALVGMKAQSPVSSAQSIPTPDTYAASGKPGTPVIPEQYPVDASGARYLSYRSFLTQSSASNSNSANTESEEISQRSAAQTDENIVHSTSSNSSPSAVIPPSPNAVNATTPRYMQYRSSLSQSTSRNDSTPSVQSPGSQPLNPTEKSDTDGKESRRSATGILAAALTGVGLGTAAAYFAKDGTNSGAVPTNGQLVTAQEKENAPSNPRYLDYRSSLSQSLPTVSQATAPNTNSVEGGSAVTPYDATASGGNGAAHGSLSASSNNKPALYEQYRSSLSKKPWQSTHITEGKNGLSENDREVTEDEETKSRNRSGVAATSGAVAVVGTAAAVGAVAAAAQNSAEAGETFPQSQEGSSSTLPRYSQYRSSLVQSVSHGKEEDVSESEESLMGPEEEADFKAKLSSYLTKGQSGNKFTSQAREDSAGPNADYDERHDNAITSLHSTQDSANRAAALAISQEAASTPLFQSQQLAVVDGSADALPVVRTDSDGPRKATTISDLESGNADNMGSRREGDRKYSVPLLSTSERRKEFCKHFIVAFLLIMVPISIGLGVALGGKDDSSGNFFPAGNSSDHPVPGPGFPTDPPSLSPLQPTPSPAIGLITPAPVTVNTTKTPTLAPSTPTNNPANTAPSMSPTPQLTQNVLRLFKLLQPLSFDGGASLQTPGTPQNQAFQWLANTTNLSDLSDARVVQRYSLATLFYSTSGENWTNNDGWLTEEDECNWFSRSTRSPVCDANGVYITLDLGFNQLNGEIPPELAFLASLRRVQMSGGTSRQLSGTLPSELGLLTYMETFTVQSNNITGPIPVEFGNWTLLQSLDLSYNNFSGQIPASIGRLSFMVDLSLEGNAMTGPLPASIGNLASLETLILSGNQFSGALTSSIGDLTLLQSLDLSSNRFVSFPSEIGLLSSLESFSMNQNNLTGTIFTELGNLTNIRLFSISGNSIRGPIPSQIGLMTRLTGLELSFNKLNGTIPSDIGLLTNMIELQLQYNQLSGQIPSSLGSLSRLTVIRLEDNNLTGTVPADVCTTFSSLLPTFYLDCGGSSPQISCPPGACCTYCCEDGVGCECVFAGTGFAFLC